MYIYIYLFTFNKQITKFQKNNNRRLSVGYTAKIHPIGLTGCRGYRTAIGPRPKCGLYSFALIISCSLFCCVFKCNAVDQVHPSMWHEQSIEQLTSR